MAVLGCIYVASSTAFNALVGCNVLLANISFSFPIGLMLFGRRQYMKPTTFPLGNILGPILNAVALGWITFMVVFFSFPFTMPAEPSNMSTTIRFVFIIIQVFDLFARFGSTLSSTYSLPSH